MSELSFSISSIQNCPAREQMKLEKKLTSYLAYLAQMIKKQDDTSLEASLCMPNNKEVIRSCEQMQRVMGTKKLKTVVVIGIGGSLLGTRAVYSALKDSLRGPELLFAGSVSTHNISSIITHLLSHKHTEEFLINVISKSGSTTETLANFEVIFEKLCKKFGKERVARRIVVTTVNNSPLFIEAKKNGFATLPHPEHVGGRFSVFSHVGTFPLLLAEVDMRAFHATGFKMMQSCVKNTKQNPARQSAMSLFHHLQKKRSILNQFFFDDRLEDLGKWGQQLIAESTGKNGKGLTPITSLGTTDLHSMVQLYLGGPDDKITQFVSVEKLEKSLQVSRKPGCQVVSGIANRTLKEILDAIFSGVQHAYQKRKRPFMHITLSTCSPASLGAYMQFKMIETMLLCKLLGVNAFDQPNVEDYKEKTRQILGR